MDARTDHDIRPMPAPYLMVLSPYGPGFWSRVIARLHAKDAVVLDGMTDGEDFRLMAARLLDDAPARFDLIGFCMGGHLAFEIMRQAPERIGKIALVSSNPLPDSAAQANSRIARIAKLETKSAEMEYPDAAYTEQAAQWLLSPISYKNSATARSAKRILADIPLRVSLRQQRAMLSRPDNRVLAEGLQTPVLIAGGADDRVVPTRALQGLCGSMAGATMHVFRGCGHLPPLERPSELAGILNRWAEK